MADIAPQDVDLRTWHAGRGLLTPWEREFLVEIGATPEKASGRQREIIADVADQLRRGARRKFRPMGRARR